MARELANRAEHVGVELAARLQSKPRLLERLDGLDDEVHAVGLIAGSGRRDLRAHFRPGEGGQVAAGSARHWRAVAGRLTRRAASGRGGSAAGRAGLAHLGIVVAWIAVRHVLNPEAAPFGLGGFETGRSIPSRRPRGVLRAGTAGS